MVLVSTYCIFFLVLEVPAVYFSRHQDPDHRMAWAEDWTLTVKAWAWMAWMAGPKPDSIVVVPASSVTASAPEFCTLGEKVSLSSRIKSCLR